MQMQRLEKAFFFLESKLHKIENELQKPENK